MDLSFYTFIFNLDSDEMLSEALYKMASHNVESWPVVNNSIDRQVIGQISRDDIIGRMHAF